MSDDTPNPLNNVITKPNHPAHSMARTTTSESFAQIGGAGGPLNCDTAAGSESITLLWRNRYANLHSHQFPVVGAVRGLGTNKVDVRRAA
jgi:hypothetical protein